MGVGLLVDTTRCIACGACSEACKESNHLPGPVEERTTASTWTTVTKVDGVPVRHLCMHCLEPTCASVCPVGALSKHAHGPVTYDPKRCIGCRYCMMACPFDVPRYQWDKPIPIIGKCILCGPRVLQGRDTACAEACPTGATLFGDRDQLLQEARTRILDQPSNYTGGIYGQREAGGTSVLYLARVPFRQLGLKTGLPEEPPAMRTWQVLGKIPDFVAVWATFLYGVHWITARRERAGGSHE